MRHPQESVEADPLLAAFDLAHINGMQFGPFRQPLLTHAGPGAVLPNCCAESLELSRARHRPPRKQEGAKPNTPNMGVFCACHAQALAIAMASLGSPAVSLSRDESGYENPDSSETPMAGENMRTMLTLVVSGRLLQRKALSARSAFVGCRWIPAFADEPSTTSKKNRKE